MEIEVIHPYTLMLREDDVLHVSFDAPAYVTLVLDRKNVHTTNRVLGFLAGKEDMDAKSAALAAWRTRERGKSRALHLKLISPGAKDARPIVIQAEWWDAVLRAPICRSLHFDGTRRTYIHDVLALVPRKHAIECVTFEGVPPAVCLASAPKLRELGVPHLAFVRCGITTVAHLGALLAEEYPDVRALTLREDDDAPVDLPAVLGQLIAYFDEHFCLAGNKDAELTLLDAELRVDIACRTAAASDEAFLLPHNLHVIINGVAQDNVDADAAAPVVADPLDGTLRQSRRRHESSDADDDSGSDGEGHGHNELHAKAGSAPAARGKGGKGGAHQRPRKKLRLDDAEPDEVDDDEPMVGGDQKRDDGGGEEGEATDDEDYREDGEAGGDGAEECDAGRAAAVGDEDEDPSEAEGEAPMGTPQRPFPGGKAKRPAAGDALADMFGRDAADRIRATDPAFARIMRNAAESAQKAAEGAALVTCVTCHCGVLKREMRDHKRRCRGGARY